MKLFTIRTWVGVAVCLLDLTVVAFIAEFADAEVATGAVHASAAIGTRVVCAHAGHCLAMFAEEAEWTLTRKVIGRHALMDKQNR